MRLLPALLLLIALHGLSSCCAFASRSTSLGPLDRLVVALPPSCLAGHCIPSPHAPTTHLRAPLPLIAPSPLVMPLSLPLPLVPLVWLVVALPLLTPLPPICQHLCLTPWCQQGMMVILNTVVMPLSLSLPSLFLQRNCLTVIIMLLPFSPAILDAPVLHMLAATTELQ